MCDTTQKVRFQLRRGTDEYWANHYDMVLLAGEPGYNTTTNQLKIGNGTSQWVYLNYVNLVGTPGAAGTPTTLVVAKIVTAVSKVGTAITLQSTPDPPLIAGQIVLFSNAITDTSAAHNLVAGIIYYVNTNSGTSLIVSLTNGGAAY